MFTSMRDILADLHQVKYIMIKWFLFETTYNV